MLVHTAHEQWASPDFFVHLAAVHEFALHPANPGNPIVTGTDPDPYLSPYTWVVAVPVRLLKVDPVTALAIAGMANLLMLLIAFKRFVSSMSNRPWTPALGLLFTLVAWGVPTWRWSGYLNLNSLGFGLPYASTFATAVALLVLAGSEYFLRGKSPWSLMVVGIGTPIVVLSHPMTALWAAGVGLAIVLAKLDREHGKRCLLLLLVALAGLAATLAWPFYGVLGLFDRVEAHSAQNMFQDFFQRTFLGLLGIVAIVLRFRKRWRDPLLIGAGLTGALCLGGSLFHIPILGRALPGLMLMLHIALADEFVKGLSKRRSSLTRLATASVVAIIIVIGLIGTAAGLVRAIPRALLPSRLANDVRLESVVAPYRVLSDRLDREDVVVAYPSLAVGTAAMSGNVIAPPVPAAFVRDIRHRRTIEEAILWSPNPKARADAVRRNNVRWLVVPPRTVDMYLYSLEEAGVSASLDLRTETLALIRIWPNGDPPPRQPLWD
jgi:hypothetical protein